MQAKSRSQKKQPLPFDQRAGYSPSEFAAQFGRQKVWAYRLIYAGKIKAIEGFGRRIIPRSEMERLLSSAQ